MSWFWPSVRWRCTWRTSDPPCWCIRYDQAIIFFKVTFKDVRAVLSFYTNITWVAPTFRTCCYGSCSWLLTILTAGPLTPCGHFAVYRGATVFQLMRLSSTWLTTTKRYLFNISETNCRWAILGTVWPAGPCGPYAIYWTKHTVNIRAHAFCYV